ncbi:hypothetical protein DVS77_21125 [Mycolicibacterium moriokaense]|nr:hypothetical protein DVS77_21125 [Mycolicibacterium moriokaense]
MTRFKYAAALVGAFGVLFLAPATAHAVDDDQTSGGGCTYTDASGFPVPIDDGQDVFVDGKLVSCRGGKIVVTTAPKRAASSVRLPVLAGNGPLLAQP